MRFLKTCPNFFHPHAKIMTHTYNTYIKFIHVYTEMHVFRSELVHMYGYFLCKWIVNNWKISHVLGKAHFLKQSSNGIVVHMLPHQKSFITTQWVGEGGGRYQIYVKFRNMDKLRPRWPKSRYARQLLDLLDKIVNFFGTLSKNSIFYLIFRDGR